MTVSRALALRIAQERDGWKFIAATLTAPVTLTFQRKGERKTVRLD